MKRVLSALACAFMVSVMAVPSAWPQSQSPTVGERVDDAKITAAVKSKLTADSVKNLVKVNVDTKDGVVHLQGNVATAADKAEAERLARATSGVKSVKNDLRVEANDKTPSASPRQ